MLHVYVHLCTMNVFAPSQDLYPLSVYSCCVV